MVESARRPARQLENLDLLAGAFFVCSDVYGGRSMDAVPSWAFFGSMRSEGPFFGGGTALSAGSVRLGSVTRVFDRFRCSVYIPYGVEDGGRIVLCRD